MYTLSDVKNYGTFFWHFLFLPKCYIVCMFLIKFRYFENSFEKNIFWNFSGSFVRCFKIIIKNIWAIFLIKILSCLYISNQIRAF